ncbi:MAG: prepilin-type N-terminal cleavage/methylation domain-containing protein [Rhodoferax sp.]|nr:prepilin-type N-terminal cleavage/methylation domain-containing protein [Rhodoferax sp.]
MRSRRPTGFSLVEMAVVVVIMGIMLALGLKTLQATQESAATSETRAKQERIKIALISFLRTNGRLPCPDIAAAPTGIEPAACATAASGYGVLPWASLGLAREAAVDGWSNFFTYRVATATVTPAAPAVPLVPRAQNNAQNWTQKTATGFNIGSLTSPTAGGFLSLQIDQRNNAGVLSTIAYNAAVVVYSHGKTGRGARTPFGTVIAAPTGADEVVNNTAGTTRFILRDYTEAAAATGGVYDDVVAFITPQDLLQPMLDDKTLKGVCSSYCVAPAAGCVAAAVPIGNPAPTCP